MAPSWEAEDADEPDPVPRGAEMLVFDAGVFDEDDSGGHVSSVTPIDRHRRNALVDAKRPSADGMVPPHGPY